MRLVRREEVPAEISEVNIVPLADVSLVLLILLMVLSPMMTQDVLRIQSAAESKAPPLELPLPPPPPKAEAVLVVGMHRRDISVGENRFSSFGAFVQFMTSVLASRSDRKVFVLPDPDVVAGRVVNMIETLKSCGASGVALVQTVEGSSSPLEAP